MSQSPSPSRPRQDSICVVVGIRPNIVKQSPLIRALERRGLPYFVIHSGQHYSYDMDRSFFEDLQLPEPAYRLQDMQRYTSHGAQSGAMVAGIESILLDTRPALVLSGGDANTDLAGALAARKLHIAVGHVEAGLRSYDWRMPEEHNRVMIDHISELLFSPTPFGTRTLHHEHVRGAIHEVGSTTVDAVEQHVALARERSDVLNRLHVTEGEYAVLTVHREENADSAQALSGILEGVDRFAREAGMPVIFPIHPRTSQRMGSFGLTTGSGIVKVPPTGYLDFLRLLGSSAALFTDSGGAQQEACILHIPCITVRESTEWIETVPIGANAVVGTDKQRIHQAGMAALLSDRAWMNPFGDGTTGERIIDISLAAISSGFALTPPPAMEG